MILVDDNTIYIVISRCINMYIIVLHLLVVQSHVFVVCNTVTMETEHTGQVTSRNG